MLSNKIAIRRLVEAALIRSPRGDQLVIHPYIMFRDRQNNPFPLWLSLGHDECGFLGMLNSFAYQKPLPFQTLETWEELPVGFPCRRANAVGLLELVKQHVIPIKGGDSVIFFYYPVNQSEFLFTFWAESDKAAREFVLKNFDSKREAFQREGFDHEAQRKRLFE